MFRGVFLKLLGCFLGFRGSGESLRLRVLSPESSAAVFSVFVGPVRVYGLGSCVLSLQQSESWHWGMAHSAVETKNPGTDLQEAGAATFWSVGYRV